MNKLLNDFIDNSVALGQNTAYVQGSGGNTSVKIDSKTMLIKSSGTKLKDLNSKKGFSEVAYKKIQNYLKNPDCEENLFSEKIRSFKNSESSRPSIETGFHAILEKAVIHTHSIYVNVLCCAIEGQTILKQLFPQSIWIPYHSPGRALTIAIQNNLINQDCRKIIFLQNHGLIVSEKTIQMAANLHLKTNQTIMDYLNIEPLQYTDSQQTFSLNNVQNSLLFPDLAVFACGDENLQKTQTAKENIWAYQTILNLQSKANLSPHFLSSNDSQYLLNMESEKYRQNLIKKNTKET